MAEWIPYEHPGDATLEVSIDVDFDDDAAYRSAHPFAVTVTLAGFLLDDGGQPDGTVVDQLYELEQRVDAACEANDAAMACTLSGDGRYRMVAYASSQSIDVPVREALEGSPFRSEVRIDRDDKWTTYETYVLRGDDLEHARDADLIEQLYEAGEDVTASCQVVFEWEIPDQSRLSAATRAIIAAGYGGPETSDSTEPVQHFDEDVEFVVDCYVTMALSADGLAAERKKQAALLGPFGARYLDWELAFDEPD